MGKIKMFWKTPANFEEAFFGYSYSILNKAQFHRPFEREREMLYEAPPLSSSIKKHILLICILCLDLEISFKGILGINN